MTHPRPYYDRVADRPAHDKAVRDWEGIDLDDLWINADDPPLPPDGTFYEQREVHVGSRFGRTAVLIIALAAGLAFAWGIGAAIDGVARWNQPINLEAPQ